MQGVLSTLLKVSEQTIWQIIGKVLISISALVIISVISKQFHETGVGVFTLSLTYLSFFYLAADLGLNIYILPNLSKSQGQSYFRKLLTIRIVWSLILVVAALILLPFFSIVKVDFYIAVSMVVLSIIPWAIFTSANAVFQVRQRYDLSTLCLLAGTLVSLIVILLLTKQVRSSAYLTAGNMLGWLITSSLALFFIRRLSFNTSFDLDLAFLKLALKKIWPIAATLLLNVVYFRLDAFILSFFWSISEVGVYNLAYQIFQTLLVFPTFIMNSFYPIMIKSLKKDPKRFYSQIKLVFLALLTLSIIGAFLTWLLAPIVIRILTTSGFSGSVISLRILSLSFPAFFISSLLMWIFICLNKYKQMLIIYVMGLIVNLILNLMFIPQYSYIASALITGISEYLILSLQLVILIRAFKNEKIYHLY